LGAGTSYPRAGYVVGDEPSAVKAASAVLREGGSATDAVTALYLSMSVTFPGAASLGGGGACVVYNEHSGRARTVTFMTGRAGAGKYGIPGNVRGFQALHSRYGKLPWARDVAYAEAMAATGFPISAALEQRLTANLKRIRKDPTLAGEFLTATGQVKPIGTIVRAPALAATLDSLRRHGPDAFYTGRLGAQIVHAIAAEGGTVSLKALAAYRAQIGPAPSMRLDGDRLFLASTSLREGGFAQTVVRGLYAAGTTARAANAEALAASVLAHARAGAHLVAPTPDEGATGFAALDKRGQAVACGVSMNGPFGAGNTVAGTGIVLAAAADSTQAPVNAAILSPMILVRNNTGPILLPGSEPEFTPVLAGAGAGGPGSAAAMAYAVYQLERGSRLSAMSRIPHALVTSNDSVNAIACHDGVCSVLTNPRAAGFAVAIAARKGKS
jgi:gamma-glutamyltranspeptidase/glutathione hydrolase